MYSLQKIVFPWEMESVSDPLFSYQENGLIVSFMVFLGAQTRQTDIDRLLSLYGWLDELQIPDEQYNNTGYRIAEFRFSGFDSLYCTDQRSGLASYKDAQHDTPAVYKEVDNENRILGYVFVGHDLFLSVKAQTYVMEICNL